MGANLCSHHEFSILCSPLQPEELAVLMYLPKDDALDLLLQVVERRGAQPPQLDQPRLLLRKPGAPDGGEVNS